MISLLCLYHVRICLWEGQSALGMHQEHLNLCSEDEQKSYRFGTTWAWVNDNTLACNIPLNHFKTPHSSHESCGSHLCAEMSGKKERALRVKRTKPHFTAAHVQNSLWCRPCGVKSWKREREDYTPQDRLRWKVLPSVENFSPLPTDKLLLSLLLWEPL